MNSKAKQVSLWERIKKQKLLLLMTVPGLVLTFIFKYIPMYGVLIAFKDYNPLKGILGSDWIGFSEFTKFISSPNFGSQHIKIKYLWFIAWLFTTNHSCDYAQSTLE